MAKRKQIDWAVIEREYRAGQLSICEIAKRHNITDAAIHQKKKRAEKNGIFWERDLSDQVRAKIRAKLVSSNVSKPNASDHEIIEEAAGRGLEVIKTHRADIAKLREVEQKLLAELNNEPEKTWIGQHQGNVITHNTKIAVTERASAHQALAAAVHKRVLLERQAFNLDESGGGEDDRAPANGECRKLLKTIAQTFVTRLRSEADE